MQEKEESIGIYNEKGKLVGKKMRKDVDKKKDILKTANVLVFNKKNQIFMIKAKDSAWKTGKLGGSCATLIRHEERSEDAARRTLQRELGINQYPEFVVEEFYNWEGIKRFLSIFKIKTNSKTIPNKDDFYESKWFSVEEAKDLLKKNKCMPTFKEAFSIINK